MSGPCELLSETTGLRFVVGAESDMDAPISVVDVKSNVRPSEGDGTVVVVATDTDTSISIVDAKSNVTARLADSEVDKTVTVADTDSKASIFVTDATSAVGFSGTVLVVGKTDNT